MPDTPGKSPKRQLLDAYWSKPRQPRLALSVEEACEALGVSWDFWKAHIEAEVKIVRRGRRKLIAVAELQRWLDESGEKVL